MSLKNHTNLGNKSGQALQSLELAAILDDATTPAVDSATHLTRSSADLRSVGKEPHAPHMVVRATGLTFAEPDAQVVADDALSHVSDSILSGDYDRASSQFAEYIETHASQQTYAMDINALVQNVMRQAYMANLQDLRRYAEKVQFYNQTKQVLRAQLARARDCEATLPENSSDKTTLTYVVPPAPTERFMPASNSDSADTRVTANDVFDLARSRETQGGLLDSNAPDTILNQLPNHGDGYRCVRTQNGEVVAFNSSTHDLRVFDDKGVLAQHLFGNGSFSHNGDDKAAWSYQNGQGYLTTPGGAQIFCSGQPMASLDVVSGADVAHLDTAVKITPDAADDYIRKIEATPYAGDVMLAQDGQVLHLDSDGALHIITDTSDGKGLGQGASVDILHGGYIITSKSQLDAYIKSLEDKLSSAGDDAQLAQVDLQNMSQIQQQTLQTQSNLSKSLYDTAMSIIRKIGS